MLSPPFAFTHFSHVSSVGVDVNDVEITLNLNDPSNVVSPQDGPTLTSGAAETTAILTSLAGTAFTPNDADIGITSSPMPSTGAPSATSSGHNMTHIEEREAKHREFVKQELARRRRRIFLAIGCGVCLLSLLIMGIVVMAIFGWLCAASLWNNTDEWACGGSGAGTAVVLLVLGMGPILVWASVFLYNSAYFLCGRRCCGEYKEINW